MINTCRNFSKLPSRGGPLYAMASDEEPQSETLMPENGDKIVETRTEEYKKSVQKAIKYDGVEGLKDEVVREINLEQYLMGWQSNAGEYD